MSGTETELHRKLKGRAFSWARQQGYSIAGIEIRLPHSNYRADVVAYRPESKQLPILDGTGGKPRLIKQPVVGTTVVFECKQARSDFLKDSHSTAETIQRLKTLEARRKTLERLLKIHQPSLLKGESLFAEYDAIDISKYEHKTYRRVLREIVINQTRLYGKTKFDKVARYKCANLCYLVVVEGIIHPHEVPLSWGLLVYRNESLVLEKIPTRQEVRESTRLDLLQRIAVAGTSRSQRELGKQPDKPD